ncbi:MAG: hypothetical protein IT324_01495 [Anaerolineae bacterium]|nr:hypothetical protein [Anaerolineae bacterium]
MKSVRLSRARTLFGLMGLVAFLVAGGFILTPQRDVGMAISWMVLGFTCLSLVK